VLAPVLARLEAVPGVAAARVDSSGRFFWLTVRAADDASAVAALALGVLGTGSRVLTETQAEAQLAAHGRGDPWLAVDEVVMLSFVESRLLSVRIAEEVQRQTGALPEQREEVAEAVRVELFTAMERVHSEGGRRSSGWIYQEWPVIAAAAARRCVKTIPDDLRLKLSGLLPELLAR
jgi:hypothetical protein